MLREPAQNPVELDRQRWVPALVVGRQPAADYVLKAFSSTERKELPLLLGDAADAVEMIVSDGLTAAQLKFHTAKA